jgi:arylsulfatase A-like enzyme
LLPAVTAALTAAFLVFGCSYGRGPFTPPNVIIITLDTVRSDHLGCYGYPLQTTPNIDAFAEKATRYTRVVASAPWTIPTHASFFTGRFPFEHGAHAFKVATPTNNVNPLPESQRTLAEVFSDEGYDTGAFVANVAYLSQRWRLDQGFGSYVVKRVYASRLNKRVFPWLRVAATTARPFFLFVNYIDAHRPYNARPCHGLLPRPAASNPAELLDSFYDAVMPGTGDVPEDLREKVVNQYNTALCNLDISFERLIQELRELGVYDNTIIVLTSDHGEFFGEHLLVEHSKDVYEEVLSIPMIVKYPGQKKGKVVNTIVSATDVPHMILSQFRGGNWEEHLAKFPDAPGEHEVISELYYTRAKDLFHPVWSHRFDRVRTAIYDWPFKYISSSDGKNELYDLEKDRAETTNLIRQDQDTAARLAGRLQAFFAERVKSEELVDQEPLSEEELDRLRSLGYVGD